MDIKKQNRLDRLYMDIAIRVSQESRCINHKVGSIIVKDDKILAIGYNGTPSNFDNVCEFKDDSGMLKTKPEVLHSESNAISKIARGTESSNNATLYVTLSTCIECAKLIIQSGIIRVVYLKEYSDISGIELLKKANINVNKFKFI